MEDKALITAKLFDLLKECRDTSDLDGLEYVNDECPARGTAEEYVRFWLSSDGIFRGGHIDVTADSGIALVKDVIKALA